jgi:hypothetical protein
MGNYVMLISVIAAMSACTHSEYSTAKELKTYVNNENNGLLQKFETDNCLVTATYWPPDLLIELEGGIELDSSKYVNLLSKYSGHYYFMVSFSKNGKELTADQMQGTEGYGKIVEIISFRMTEYAFLVNSESDTLEAKDFQSERTYGIGNSTNILFLFDKKDNQKNVSFFELCIKEFGLKVGNHCFRFNRSDLQKVPKLRFKIT